jgi:hypothetical protein
MSAKLLKIDRVDRNSDDELIAGYSDETTVVYGVDQLTSLTPKQTFAATAIWTKGRSVRMGPKSVSSFGRIFNR